MDQQPADPPGRVADTSDEAPRIAARIEVGPRHAVVTDAIRTITLEAAADGRGQPRHLCTINLPGVGSQLEALRIMTETAYDSRLIRRTRRRQFSTSPDRRRTRSGAGRGVKEPYERIRVTTTGRDAASRNMNLEALERILGAMRTVQEGVLLDDSDDLTTRLEAVVCRVNPDTGRAAAGMTIDRATKVEREAVAEGRELAIAIRRIEKASTRTPDEATAVETTTDWRPRQRGLKEALEAIRAKAAAEGRGAPRIETAAESSEATETEGGRKARGEGAAGKRSGTERRGRPVYTPWDHITISARGTHDAAREAVRTELARTLGKGLRSRHERAVIDDSDARTTRLHLLINRAPPAKRGTQWRPLSVGRPAGRTTVTTGRVHRSAAAAVAVINKEAAAEGRGPVRLVGSRNLEGEPGYESAIATLDAQRARRNRPHGVRLRAYEQVTAEHVDSTPGGAAKMVLDEEIARSSLAEH